MPSLSSDDEYNRDRRLSAGHSVTGEGEVCTVLVLSLDTGWVWVPGSLIVEILLPTSWIVTTIIGIGLLRVT